MAAVANGTNVLLVAVVPAVLITAVLVVAAAITAVTTVADGPLWQLLCLLWLLRLP